MGIDGVTFILEHTIAQQLLSNGLAACSLINYQGRGLATSELTLRQHTRSSVFSDLVKNGFNNNNNNNALLPLFL